MKPHLETAQHYIECLTGSRYTVMDFRCIHDSDKYQPAIKRRGAIANLWSEFLAFQEQGYGIFAVVNEGGNTDAEIIRIRAVFIDADNVPFTDKWHLPPDFIVQRDTTHYHIYWLATDLPVAQFRKIQ